MRAVLAVAAFAVVAQAAALPASELNRRTDLGLPSTPDVIPPGGGIDPNDPNSGADTTPADPSDDNTTVTTPPADTNTDNTTPPADTTTDDATKTNNGQSGQHPGQNGQSGQHPGQNGQSGQHPGQNGQSGQHPGQSGNNDHHDQSSGTTTYTPYYPDGGYKPPKTYPSGSDYSDSKPYDSGSYTGDYNTPSHPYNPSYPAKDNYGQKDNYGDDYQPTGYTKPSGYDVSYPRKGDSVECGKPHKIQWSGFKGKKVKIEVVYGHGKDDCHHYAPVADDCDNNGSYEWTPPKNLPPTGGKYGYGYKFTCKDTGDVVYSPQFSFQNNDFYNDYKHPACPTVAPTPITIPCETATPTEAPVEETPAPVETPCETAPAQTQEAAPPATTPCPPTAIPAPPAIANNATSPEAPTSFASSASGIKASFTFVAGLAVLVAFAL